MAPLILHLGTKWRRVLNFTLPPPYPRKEPQYALSTRWSGPQSRFRNFGEEKYLLSRAGFEPRIARSVVAKLTNMTIHM